MKTLLFIPAYNCEKQIIRVLEQLNHKVMKNINEIIVVNNRSTDSTEEAVIEYAKQNVYLPIKVLKNNENYGLGGSHKVAFNYAVDNEFDYVIVLHGDDQGNINDFLHLMQSNFLKQEYDCYLGARFHRNSQLKGYSRFRTFGNIVYNFLFSLPLSFKVRDLGSGLNAYSTRIFKDKFYMEFPDDLTFNYSMILASGYYKHKIIFLPITWREEDQVSNVKMFSQALRVLKILGRYMVNKDAFILESNSLKQEKCYSYSVSYDWKLL